MANYPTSLDTITNPTSGNTLDNPSHSLQHSDANDILEALETKLGIGASPAGSATSGHALVASTGGTTSWTTIGTAGISSGAATNGQVLTANGSSGVSFTTLPTSGLVLLNTTSFSAVASQDINDVFSSTYDHYKIFFLAKMASSEGSVSIRMKTGSVDSGSVYAYAIVSLGANNTSYNQTSTSTTSGYFGRVGNGIDGGYEITIFNPNKATGTTYIANGVGNGPTATFTERAGGGVFTTTQYTGIQFLSVGGINITGSVSIYGVNK